MARALEWELDEDITPGAIEGADGWTGRTAINVTEDGRAYFEPEMPRAAARLTEEGREAFISVQRSVMAVREAQARLDEQIEWARDAGVSWALLGWCLGLTGEAARKRWGGEPR